MWVTSMGFILYPDPVYYPILKAVLYKRYLQNDAGEEVKV